MIRNLLLPLLLALPACEQSQASSSQSGTPDKAARITASDISGSWKQVTASGDKGMTVDFDGESGKILVHTAPDKDGGHDHLDGSFTLDTAAGSITVNCALLGKDKGSIWKGKLDGGRLTLTAGGSTLNFDRGGDPHGHK